MSILDILKSKFDWLGAHIHANITYDLQQAGKVAEAAAEAFLPAFKLVVQNTAAAVFNPKTPADVAAVKNMTFEQKVVYAVEKIGSGTIGSLSVSAVLQNPTIQLALRSAASAIVAGLLA